MTGILADAVQRLKLQPGQSVREAVNGHIAELRLLDNDQPTTELAEQVMLLPWWEPPFDAMWTDVAEAGPGRWPDPPVIPPDDESG